MLVLGKFVGFFICSSTVCSETLTVLYVTRRESIKRTFQKNEMYTLSIIRVSEWEASEGSHLCWPLQEVQSGRDEMWKYWRQKMLKSKQQKSVFFCTSASAWRFRMWLTSIDSGSLSSAHTAECFTVSVSVVRLILNHQRVLWPLSPPRLCGTSCSDSGHPESSFSLTVFLLEAVITRISVSVCVCQRKEKLWF